MLNLILSSLIAVCPTISAKTPKTNEVLKGTYSFEATAADDRAGLEVTFWYAGKQLFNIEKTAPYMWSVDTGIFPDGNRTVSYKAKDSGGCIKEASVSFSVKNALPTPAPQPTPVPTSSPTPAPATPSPSPSATPSPSPTTSLFPASVAKTGYTTLKPSADSKIIYVSTSGSDSSDGLSPSKPIKTPSEAFKKVRTGMPDWIVFKSGDVWDRKIVGLGNASLTGRSALEPKVISRYGVGPRPRFNIGNENGFEANGTVSNVVIEGLHIRGRIMEDPTVKHAQAVRMVVGGGTNILFENNYFEKVNDGISISDGSVAKKNVVFRRNVFADVMTRDPGHAGRSSCIYASKIDGLLLIENVWDLCGWSPTLPKTRTVFSHGAYIADTVYSLVARGNIFTRGSHDGLKMRRGGLAEDNFFAQNGVGISVNDYKIAGVSTVLKDNVFTDGSLQPLYDYSSTPQVRNYGTWAPYKSGASLSDTGNIFVHSGTGAQGSKAFADQGSVSNNIIYKWGRSASKPGPFADPTRTLESYHKSIGGSGDKLKFFDEMRNQSRESYKPEYSATKINDYFQEGFK